ANEPWNGTAPGLPAPGGTKQPSGAVFPSAAWRRLRPRYRVARGMTETPREAQAGVADALRDLSDNSRALVRHEIAAAQREMWGKARQALPAAALLGAAACLGVLSAAASFRLSVQLLEKALPPAAASFTAAAGYGVAGGA